MNGLVEKAVKLIAIDRYVSANSGSYRTISPLLIKNEVLERDLSKILTDPLMIDVRKIVESSDAIDGQLQQLLKILRSTERNT